MGPFRTKIANTIRKHGMIQPGEKIVMGVSGGPDSMALLYILYDLREELGCALHIAHLDHKLRGEESIADAECVREHAKKLDLPISVEVINVHQMITSKESLESGARRIRYDFYERVIAHVQGDKVAQGHSSDDQAETVMMRLLRGSGARGLGGIPPVRDHFIRPLIETSRNEIEGYLRQMQIIPRYDASNLSTEYTRNKIRLELLPLLEREYSPNIKHILRQTGEILRTEDDFLEELAAEAVEKCVDNPDSKTAMICVSALGEYKLALQRRIIRIAIEKLVGNLVGFDYNHIRDLLDLAFRGVTGSVLSLPRQISAQKSYDSIILNIGPQSRIFIEDFYYQIKMPGDTIIPELDLLISVAVPEKSCGEYNKPQTEKRLQATFDYDKIRGELHLRNRRNGDRFQPLGMSGTKKLKDFFIDEKIPGDMRDRVPILTNGDEILWIVGYRIDDRFKVTSNTRKRLTIIATYSNKVNMTQ